MTHEQAEKLALELMDRHGLIDSGWQFAWSRGKRQLGSCREGRQRDDHTGKMITFREIRLSVYLVALNSDDEVRDTILHEIAHALAGVRNGHNHLWEAACRKVGAKPQRLAGEQVVTVAAPWELVCSMCEAVLGNRHRRPAASWLRRAYCRHCGQKSVGKLDCRSARSVATSLFE